MVYLDTNGNPDDKGEVSSFVELLWEMGLQNEAEYLESLGDMEISNLESLTLDAAAAQTLELMNAGVPLIYQGVIKHEDLTGKPDLLLRSDESSSSFGDFHYEPIDIKAGKGRKEW